MASATVGSGASPRRPVRGPAMPCDEEKQCISTRFSLVGFRSVSDADLAAKSSRAPDSWAADVAKPT
ncbi:hypothetical protein BHE74_00008385 [Ensete ventricosum]|nr:hypothetical protein GW17_00019893 [Ensete ventricosum]RWW83123.1 hypothetical protein BHE74_00008385 [Ensete ventricosum]